MAGEGSFVVTRKLPPFVDGSPRLRFVFQVTVAARDRPLLEALQQFLGPATEAAFLAGFVAAEGCFTTAGPRRFVFAVGVGAADAGACEAFRRFLGAGHVHRSPRRRAHYDDEVTFAVTSLPELVHLVVPFADAHLPPSHKRDQYEAWRARLLEYWETRAKRARPCTIDGCDGDRRAKGLCRRHYYQRFRQ